MSRFLCPHCGQEFVVQVLESEDDDDDEDLDDDPQFRSFRIKNGGCDCGD